MNIAGINFAVNTSGDSRKNGERCRCSVNVCECVRVDSDLVRPKPITEKDLMRGEKGSVSQ
jgi:hypothetical protein